MTDAAKQERWVFCDNAVGPAIEDESATDGFKRRIPSGPFVGHILEEFIADGESAPAKLQPTGDPDVEFFSYWLGTINAGYLIRIRQDDDGVYRVFGGECGE